MGIAGLIFNKAPRSTKGEVKYIKKEVIESGETVKKYLLPDSHSFLQERLDKFLLDNKLKIGSSSLLIDGPNTLQPKVEIDLQNGKPKGKCFICGEPSHSLREIGGTVFPMISGSSGALSFNSNGGKPEKVCWKCDYIGKFVPVNGFYTMNGDNLHIYLPYSPNIEKMLYISNNLQAIKINDPNLFRNFNQQMEYCQRPYEQLFSFLYSLYTLVLIEKVSKDADKGMYTVNLENNPGVNLLKDPLDFFVVNTESLGDTQMGKLIWPFKDAVYFFRLMERVEHEGIDIKEVMRILIDSDEKKSENKTIIRNKICERILKKKVSWNLLSSMSLGLISQNSVILSLWLILFLFMRK